MSYVWTVIGTALLTAVVTAWLLRRDWPADDIDTDYMTDYSMENEP